MRDVLDALAAQHAELDGLLSPLDDAGWASPTRCEGWDVSDVVLHLAQTDEMAIGSLEGRLAEVAAELSEGLPPMTSVDDGVEQWVRRERGRPNAELQARWRDDADRLRAALADADPSRRVPWVAGELSARTLATTRLAETWIHTGDVAEALEVERVPGEHLRLIARLAWRTLPYAFSVAGRELSGPVAFRLTGPGGDAWDFVPDEAPVTTISGAATELCDVAARRLDPAATNLRGEGPDADAVLELVRTYAA